MKRFIQKRSRSVAIKWYIVVKEVLYREDANGKEQTVEPFFRSITYRLLTADQFSDHELNEALQKVVAGLEKYIHESSGWILKSVKKLQVHTISYRPLRPPAHMELPSSFKRSLSILNIRNTDYKCFVYCILAALQYPKVAYSERISDYKPFEKDLNMNGITYPVRLRQLDRFERLNKHISINFFGFEHSDILPLRITKNTQRQKHVNLLLIKGKKGSHYCLIKNFDKFLSRT